MGYLIEPTFIATDGKTYTCKVGIDENTMNQLKQNSQIEITYNTKDPTICEVKNAVINDTAGSRGDFVEITIWAGGILAFIGGILSLIKFLNTKKQKNEIGN